MHLEYMLLYMVEQVRKSDVFFFVFFFCFLLLFFFFVFFFSLFFFFFFFFFCYFLFLSTFQFEKELEQIIARTLFVMH